MLDTPSKSDIAEIRRVLPDELDVIESATRETIWILYNDYLMAEWDPCSDEVRVRLHLMETDQDVVELDLDQLSRALQHLQIFNFRITGDHTIPAQIEGNERIKILLFETPYADTATLRDAILLTFSVSRPAIETGLETYDGS